MIVKITKTVTILILTSGLIFMAYQASASGVGARTKYLYHESWFNKTTDYIATLGKSSFDKKRIKHNRRIQRRNYRLKKLSKSK